MIYIYIHILYMIAYISLYMGKYWNEMIFPASNIASSGYPHVLLGLGCDDQLLQTPLVQASKSRPGALSHSFRKREA